MLAHSLSSYLRTNGARMPVVRASSSPSSSALARRPLIITGVLGAASRAAPRAFAAACEDYNTTPDGLKWCDTKEGTGAEPVKGAKIKAHYAGTLESGKEFDSSYKRGQPLAFQVGVGQVIKGWDVGILGGEGIPPMKVGGKRKLIIPASLGYGARGAGGVIPPNATLLFDVELVAA